MEDQDKNDDNPNMNVTNTQNDQLKEKVKETLSGLCQVTGDDYKSQHDRLGIKW